MKYCVNCGCEVKDEQDTCPKCKEHIKENLNEEEKRTLLKNAHFNERKGYDVTQNALCFVVLGAIVLIIGIVFFALSFKYTAGKGKIFTPSSAEFAVFIVGTVVGSISFIYGWIKFIIGRNYQKKYLSLIDSIRNNTFHQ